MKKMCKEACQFQRNIESKNWAAVFATLIEDENQDTQKYAWLSELAEGHELYEKLFETLSYCEHVHCTMLLHPVFVRLIQERVQVYGKPSDEQQRVWNAEHAEAMADHAAALDMIDIKSIVEADAAKYELLAQLCEDDAHKARYMQMATAIKGVK